MSATSRHLAISSAPRAPEYIDEFTCGSCFLVRHRSQLARQSGEVSYCTDCEG